MTDEEKYTYARTVKAEAGRRILKALRDNAIGCRATLSENRVTQSRRSHPGQTMTIYVKPERQRRFDKFVDRFDT